MVNFCEIPLASLREDSITELDLSGKGVGVPGAIVLSKLLPSAAALTSLKCARGPTAFEFVAAPPLTRLLCSEFILAYTLTAPTSPIPCSLSHNQLGDEGASALAAVLKETQITNLKYAAAPECSLSCQRPLTRSPQRPPPLPCSQTRPEPSRR